MNNGLTPEHQKIIDRIVNSIYTNLEEAFLDGMEFESNERVSIEFRLYGDTPDTINDKFSIEVGYSK